MADTVISGGSRIFPRGGREPSRGGVNTPNFPENCMKSKEFGRPGGGVRPSRPPPRSANGYGHGGYGHGYGYGHGGWSGGY